MFSVSVKRLSLRAIAAACWNTSAGGKQTRQAGRLIGGQVDRQIRQIDERTCDDRQQMQIDSPSDRPGRQAVKQASRQTQDMQKRQETRQTINRQAGSQPSQQAARQAARQISWTCRHAQTDN